MSDSAYQTPPVVPDKPVTIWTATDRDAIINDRLTIAVRRYAPKAQFSVGYVWEKMLAAEAEAQRELRVYFRPREVLPYEATVDEIAAIQADETRYPIVQEPSYDYDPAYFDGSNFSPLILLNTQIITIHSMVFSYPTAAPGSFTVPNEWLRADLKTGSISFLPMQSVMGLQLNGYLLSALSGSRWLPNCLQIRYSCGLQNPRATHPDLLDVLKRKVVLGLVEDLFIPASMSGSMDGLSQSISFQSEKYQEIVDRKMARLQQSLQGIVVL